MDDQDTLCTSPAKREAWNKGKFTGAKALAHAERSKRWPREFGIGCEFLRIVWGLIRRHSREPRRFSS
jgi:hypothetical protein